MEEASWVFLDLLPVGVSGGADPSPSSRGSRAEPTLEDACARPDAGNQAMQGWGSESHLLNSGFSAGGEEHAWEWPPGPMSGPVSACRAGAASVLELLDRPLPPEASGWPSPPCHREWFPLHFKNRQTFFCPQRLLGRTSEPYEHVFNLCVVKIQGKTILNDFGVVGQTL